MKLGLVLLVCPLVMPVSASAASGAGDVLAGVAAWFEPAPNQIFISRSNNGLVNVEPSAMTFRANGKTDRLAWAGANAAHLSGSQFDGAYTDYHVGAPAQWRSQVPHFSRVEANNLYPGVDAIYYWRDGQFEFDLHVAPGAGVDQIRLKTSEAPIRQPDGALVAGQFRLRPAIAYQETPSGRVNVSAGYRVTDGEIGFTAGPYDHSLALVIDPIVFVGFFGGDQYGRANAIATTPDGVIFIVGGASSEVIINSTNPEYYLPAGKGDAFLAKFIPDADGNTRLTHYTFWGGAFYDEAKAVVTGKDGLVYFSGDTESPDFPIFGARIQDPIGGLHDSFLVVLKPEAADGQNIWFSGYYGGAGMETTYAVAVDSDGAAYIGGTSTSVSIPGMTSGLQCCNRGTSEAWMAKINIFSGTPLVYSTYIGGAATDIVTGIAVDANKNVYLGGYTASTDFPVTVSPQARRRSDYDMFVVKLDLNRSGLDALVDGFYVYGNSIDIATGLALSGNRLYVTGYTLSTDLPVPQNGYRNKRAANTDAFVLGFDYTKPAPYPITWGTYFGGLATDVSYGISVGNGGWVAIAGYTTSSDFPLKDSENNATLKTSIPNAFLAVFNPAENGDLSLKLSRVVGGSVQDIATGVAADQNGRYFASGISRSYDTPVTNGSSRGVEDGAEQSFIIRAKAP